MNIAIIPARGGSRRIPRKNIRDFHGKPIIAHSIDLAQRSGLFQKIVVSTEDPEIVQIAKDLGAKIHHRAKALADDYTGTQDVMRAALTWWLSCTGLDHPPEHACCIYATAPTMTAEDLVRGHAEMLARGDYAYTHGWFYWGRTEWFLSGRPLPDAELVHPVGRWIDINDEADWARAEQIYEEMHASH